MPRSGGRSSSCDLLVDREIRLDRDCEILAPSSVFVAAQFDDRARLRISGGL